MSQIAFVTDVMVGKLARWLRVLGFDVAYSNTYEDDQIIRIAEEEHRIILTRDTGMAARSTHVPCLLIDSDDYREQVRQVLHAYELKDFKVFSRCLECNAPLEALDKEAAFERVPPFVYLTQDRFASCPSCKRVYWHGTHADQMLKQLAIQL